MNLTYAQSNLLELGTDFFNHIAISASVNMPGAPIWQINRRLYTNRCLDIFRTMYEIGQDTKGVFYRGVKIISQVQQNLATKYFELEIRGGVKKARCEDRKYATRLETRRKIRVISYITCVITPTFKPFSLPAFGNTGLSIVV